MGRIGMATKKQVEANRRNAKKSTGPKTAEGKARSAQNAIKHGLLSRQAVLADEDGEAFAEMRRNLHEDFRPESQLEVLLVNRLAAQQWRLARIPALEAELMETLRRDYLGQDEGLGAAWMRDAEPYGGALARLSRYETALERSVTRLLEQLRQAQAQRRRLALALAQAGAGLPVGRDSRPWWERAAAAFPGGGAERGADRAAGAPAAAVRARTEGPGPAAPRLPAAPEVPAGEREAKGGARSGLRNEANPAPLLSQRPPAESRLQTHLSGEAFREPGPALHRLSPALRPGAKPNGKG
jgi:hypothetical protein